MPKPKISVVEVKQQPDIRNGIEVGAVKSWRQVPHDGVVLILGEQGEGKSAAAWWIAEGGRNGTIPGWPKTGKKREVVAYKLPEAAKRYLPKYVRIVQSIADLKRTKDLIVVYDETAKSANARRAMSSDNVEAMELNALARQFGHLILYIAQHSKQPDPDIVINSKWILHKHPSLLHIRFTRPELRPEYELTLELFGRIKEREWKKHVVVIDYKHGQAGVLKNGLATFWSEKLSTIYASGAEEQKKPRQRRNGNGPA